MGGWPMSSLSAETAIVKLQAKASRWTGRLARTSFVGALCFALTGCGSQPTFEFDELDMVPGQEELTEFALGEYKIPIPVVEYHADDRKSHRNRFQFDFKLFALVPASERWQIEDAWNRHQGKIRDRVIRVCRNASLDDLQEPQLASLKAQLIDSIGPQLGEKALRQLMITEIVSQEI
jgi:hypothetical protein